jgi:GTP-binding protein
MSTAPESVIIKSVEFLFGAPSVEDIRPQRLPEIAVVGRSNVGKSSLINRLLCRKVARVSGKPGCTLQINFFDVQGRNEVRDFRFALVDLPGFGFAKVSKQEREELSRMIVSYVQTRERLQAVLLLNDCRRAAGEDEVAVQRMCAEAGVPVIVVATKIDTLNRAERAKAIPALACGFHLEAQDLVISGEKVSVGPIWERFLCFVCND